MEIEEVKKEIKRILKEELKGTQYHAFFFGSRVSGIAAPRSDIDVGLEGEEEVLPAKLSSIKARFESLPTLYRVDVVDFSKISGDFKKVAKAHVEVIV